ncbi:hypothetical protein [Myxococcus sp. AS-1-15]|uniref:hypothetical protein n=1 Tax=Myxococcus sp. AS-1-15 TaxID=2874600 RepID=UPI001CC0A41A|nr:hypothetical protein [Myxococcus sp. AS-1-15]MBZ4402429.1 hypothetical protein [Myxococcus sp. AS-1-15]
MKKLFSLAAVVAVALFAPFALADTGDPAPIPSLTSILLNALAQVVPILFAAVVAVITSRLTGLTQRFQAQADSSKLAAVGARVTALAESIVRDVEVTLKPKLVAATADGVLTPAEFKQLKDAALDQLLKSLGERGLAELQEVFQLTASNVGTFLSSLIESALDRMKSVKASAKTSVTALVDPTALGAIGAAAALAPVGSAVVAVPQMPRGGK